MALNSLIHDFKRFAKDKEVAKINKAMIGMAKHFNLGIDKNNIEEH